MPQPSNPLWPTHSAGNPIRPHRGLVASDENTLKLQISPAEKHVITKTTHQVVKNHLSLKLPKTSKNRAV